MATHAPPGPVVVHSSYVSPAVPHAVGAPQVAPPVALSGVAAPLSTAIDPESPRSPPPAPASPSAPLDPPQAEDARAKPARNAQESHFIEEGLRSPWRDLPS